MTTNEQLKALAEAAKNWHVNHAMPENDDGIVEVGHMLDGEFYPIVIVDCVQYDQSSQPLAAYIAAANPERILALIAENERLRGVLDEIATINSLTATQPQFIRYLQNTAQAALCHGKDPDSCWNTRCNLGHKCRSALGETK
mgnify:CR=1 FL=1